MHNPPYPAHNPDGLEGEGGVGGIPGCETPRPLLPPRFPEVEPTGGLYEVKAPVLEGRVLLHDELIPGADGPGPAVIHRAAPDLIQGCASHRARVAQRGAIVKRKDWWFSPPSTPVL